jgi:hypothetical protein
VALTALEKGPVLDFAEYKTIETLYTGVDPGGARSAFEIQRRYEQARAHRVQQARRHLFALVPEALKVQPSLRFAVLSASLGRDPFGTLDHFRENGVADPFAGLSTDQRLDLLDQVAALGLGLASTHLDLFAIPGEAPWIKRLQGVFRKDMTAGSTILGVYAMEGMHHYPFGLDRIEPALPRRITNADALAHLRRGEPEGVEPREFSTIEVGEAADRLIK